MLTKKKLHVKKDDQVIVMTGDHKGKRGRVLRTFPQKGLVVVEGVNFITKHLRRTRENPQGGRLEKEAPIRASNVMLVDGDAGARFKMVARKEKRGTREVTFRYRVFKKSGAPASVKDKEYAEKKG